MTAAPPTSAADRRSSPNPLVAAVDLGGTKTTAALVAADGEIVSRRTVPTPAAAGPAAVLDVVVDLIDQVAAAVPDGGAEPPGAVGIGAAGLIDVDHGTVVSATDTFPGWPGTAVGPEVSARLEVRWGRTVAVHVQNDVDAHGAGEAWRGAGQGCRSVLLVTVGTGIGASVLLDGAPRHGAHWGGGEIGHVPVPGAEGLRCPCGRIGHLEAVAAGAAVARRYREQTGVDLAGRQVVERAGARDHIASALVQQAGEALGRALAGQVTVLDPELIILGGGFTGAGPLWWQSVEQTLRAELVDLLADVPMVPAQLGADAALLGAARSALGSAALPSANTVEEGADTVEGRSLW